MYAPEQCDFIKNYGNIYLKAGEHTLSFRLAGVGKNAASAGYDLTFGKFILSEIIPDAKNILTLDSCGSVYCGNTVGYLPKPEKEGFIFDGWTAQSGERVTSGDAISENMTLYPNWREKSENVVKVYVSGGSTPFEEIYAKDGESLDISFIPDSDSLVPTVSVNGADMSQSVKKTDEGYILTVKPEGKCVVFVSFSFPYNFEKAYSRIDYKTIPLSKAYIDLAAFEYTLVPLEANEGYLGFCGSDNTPASWTSFNISIRMTKDGKIEARNGGAYEAVNPVKYEVGKAYKISVCVDAKNRRYSADIYDENGNAVTLAENYAFRSDAPETQNIAKICVNAGYNEAANLFYIENFRELSRIEILSRDTKTGAVVISSPKNEDAVLICVECSDGNIKVETMKVSLKEGANTFTSDGFAGAEKTLMLWKSLTSLTPLCEEKSF